MVKFKFIDLFSGIGGFRIALEKCGGKCVGYSEIDKQAIEIYEKNFDTSNEIKLGDITKIQTLPQCDVIVGGVPCQPWSVAGKMKGFGDERGQLWHDVFRLVGQAKPKTFIFENVKGIIDPRNKDCFDLIIQAFKEFGYEVFYKLLNAYDFGLPQNRDRVFIVGIRKDINNNKIFSFPNPNVKDHRLSDFLDDIELNNTINHKKFDPKELFGEKIPFSRNRFQKIDEVNDFFVFCDTRNGHTTIHSWDIIDTTEQEKQICMMILRNRRKSKYGNQDGNPLSFDDLKCLKPDIEKNDISSLVKKNILRMTKEDKYEFVNSKNSSGINGIYRVFLPESNIFSTLTATGTKDHVATISLNKQKPEEYKREFIEKIFKNNKFRSITIREAARLQGFPESYLPHQNYKVAMKQFGNAVPVNVVLSLMNTIKNDFHVLDEKMVFRLQRQIETNLL